LVSEVMELKVWRMAKGCALAGWFHSLPLTLP
jgi:hypothetical protein